MTATVSDADGSRPNPDPNPVISGGLPTSAGRIHLYQGSVVAGGSRGMTGAPCLSAEAATRAGAGYVSACIPRAPGQRPGCGRRRPGRTWVPSVLTAVSLAGLSPNTERIVGATWVVSTEADLT